MRSSIGYLQVSYRPCRLRGRKLRFEITELLSTHEQLMLPLSYTNQLVSQLSSRTEYDRTGRRSSTSFGNFGSPADRRFEKISCSRQPASHIINGRLDLLRKCLINAASHQDTTTFVLPFTPHDSTPSALPITSFLDFWLRRYRAPDITLQQDSIFEAVRGFYSD